MGPAIVVMGEGTWNVIYSLLYSAPTSASLTVASAKDDTATMLREGGHSSGRSAVATRWEGGFMLRQ